MALDDIDKRLLALAEDDMEVCERPFDTWAERLGIREHEVIERLQRLKEAGIVRDFKAVLRHGLAGYTANAMVVWAVPDNALEATGQAMALSPRVTHCYERVGFAPYNLFTMVHARSPQELQRTIEDLAQKTGIADYRIFGSVRELKKTSMRYFAGEEGRDE